jgi:aminopyrrolnitrin oxygenase
MPHDALAPAVPNNWYLLSPSQQLKSGHIQSHDIGGHRLVLYRGLSTGKPIAMAAHCAHMGCHLSSGAVLGDDLRCGLHFRKIGADGMFGRDSQLRQKVYQVAEYQGGVFAYLGPETEPPKLETLGIDDCTTSYAGMHAFPLPWQALVANGFDAEHLASVHDRKLREDPTLEIVSPREIRLRYVTQPSLRTLSDRVIGWLAKDGVHGTIRALGGSLMLVESRVGKRATFILLSFVPDSTGGTSIRGLAGVRGKPNLRNRLYARIAAVLFRSFLNKDLAVLERLEWHEPARLESLGDGFTRRLCDHFRSLEGA